MDNIINLLNGLEYLYPENLTISRIKRVLNSHPEELANLSDAYSVGQIKSKEWLVNNLPNDLGTVFICAGWYGTLATMMFERCPEKFKNISKKKVQKSKKN